MADAAAALEPVLAELHAARRRVAPVVSNDDGAGVHRRRRLARALGPPRRGPGALARGAADAGRPRRDARCSRSGTARCSPRWRSARSPTSTVVPRGDPRGRRRVAGAPRDAIRAYVTGWGAAVPDGVLTNADLEATHRHHRRVDRRADRHPRAPDRRPPTRPPRSLAIAAGRAAIKRAGLTPDAIDLLVLATATPEQPIPHTGAFVGEGIGLALRLVRPRRRVRGLRLRAGRRRVDAHRRRARPRPRRRRRDAVAHREPRATVAPASSSATPPPASCSARSRGDDGPGLLAWDLGCDGSATGLLEIRAGGSRMPTTAETVAAGEHYLRMAGQEVFRRAVRVVVDSALATLERGRRRRRRTSTGSSPTRRTLRIIDAARASGSASRRSARS